MHPYDVMLLLFYWDGKPLVDVRQLLKSLLYVVAFAWEFNGEHCQLLSISGHNAFVVCK